MKAGPSTEDLLALARDLVANELAPALSGSPRYAALMVASALSIVGRELARRPATDAGSTLNLWRLVSAVAPDVDTASRHDPAQLEQTLCNLIRAGAFDVGMSRGDLVQHLVSSTIEALLDVNPTCVEQLVRRQNLK